MPKKSDINIHINDGDAMLYRRERSSNWYLRYKDGLRGWRRVSCETDNEDKAKAKAKEIIKMADARHLVGLKSAPSSNFRSIAQLVTDNLSKTSNGKNNDYHLMLAIRKYLIPFFGNKALSNLNSTDFETYVGYVTNEMKKAPQKN